MRAAMTPWTVDGTSSSVSFRERVQSPFDRAHLRREIAGKSRDALRGARKAKDRRVGGLGPMEIIENDDRGARFADLRNYCRYAFDNETF